MKHIEGPLTYFVGNSNGRGLIRIEEEDTGEHIASAPRGAQSEANIAELVRRYNSHSALLAALKDAVEMQEAAFDELKAHLSPASKTGWIDKIAKHKAAIAAAEPKAEGKG